MNACITGRSTFSRNELLAKAAAVDAKVAAGEPLAPLEGLPVVVRAPGRKALLYWERRPLLGEVKLNIDVAGEKCTASTAALKSHRTPGPEVEALGAARRASTHAPKRRNRASIYYYL